MQITQHGAYLAKLSRLRMVNMYLVEETDGLTLIDSGFGGNAPGIIAAAQQLQRPIRRITLTHAHGDHAGSLDALAAALPEAEILLPQRTAVFLAGDLALLPSESQVPLRGSYITATTAPDRTVLPGERVGSLRVVAAPGHAPDQVAFFDERDGTLIGGDAFQTLGGLAVSGVLRWRFPLPALASWHLPTAVVTARNLAALQPARLAVGHGQILEDPGAALAQAIAEAEGRLDVQEQTA